MNKPTSIKERADALRDEIARWLDLVNRIEQRATQTNDVSSFGVIGVFLHTGRKSFEKVMESKSQKEFRITPVVESREISLPSFPLPGNGVPVKARKESVRLPDPGHIPEA